MTKNSIILFKRANDEYPISGIASYTPTAKMKKPITKLYNWLLEKKSIDVKLTSPNQTFFNSIYSFCESNDLNPKKSLRLKAFIEDDLNFLEIEQSNANTESLILNKSIYSKITYEINNKKNLSIHELNNLEQAHELYRKNIQTVFSSIKNNLQNEGNIKKLKETELEEKQLLNNTI